MQKLTLKNIGPIVDCALEVDDFMVFTGEQASGKSTIAKSIFFFNNLKNILFAMCQKNMTLKPLFEGTTLEQSFLREVYKAFTQSFGNAGSNIDGFASYEYDNGSKVTVYFQPDEVGATVKVEVDDSIKKGLGELEKKIESAKGKDAAQIKEFINNDIFASDMEVIYIPAGRSMLTVLSAQINYLYSVMDDRIRSMIDYCTQQFMENVLLLKDYFNNSYENILKSTIETVNYPIDEEKAKQACVIMQKILGGQYRTVNGEERLYFENDKYVKINYASSGQQEAVWIINILFYYMLGQRKTFFIIEEPESHLFPATQKAIIDLISLVKNGENKVLITTHSPYVLGSINNLIFAYHVAVDEKKKAIKDVVNERLWINPDYVGAYYIKDGKTEDIMDREYKDINHDVIDGVSGVLNEEYEKMLGVSEGD